MKLKKKNKMKTVELILYWIILVLFLFANLYYFRGFHKIPFIMASIVCMIKTIRYIVVKKWHIINVVVSGFMMYAILQFTCEMDIFFFPSTELRHYEETVHQYGITEDKKYGIFPRTIPEGATDIEYFYTTDRYLNAGRNMHAYLKMTVNEEYLQHLMDRYSIWEVQRYELDCSIITKENAHEYMPKYYLHEYAEEFYGEKNCFMYYIEEEGVGYIINWDKNIVKLFKDYRVYTLHS